MADKTTNKFTDKDWVRELFVVGQDQLDGLSLDERNWSTSDYKFNDTGMGGSIVINPLPQPSPVLRSEERRVGKECRSRWSPYH